MAPFPLDGQLIYRGARSLWRTLPTGFRSWASPGVGRALTALSLPFLTRPLPRESIRPGDILVSGFFSDINGIGRAGRLTLAAVEQWGTPVLRHDLRLDPVGSSISPTAQSNGLWICHCNPPETLSFMLSRTEHVWGKRYRIGYWAYELPRLPPSWKAGIGLFHEIWAPSQFVADAIGKAMGRSGPVVRVVPHPLPDVRGINPDRRGFSIGPAFTFLAMFDTRSSLARKNPMGAVKAFQSAFRQGDESAALVLKVVNANADVDAVEELEAQTMNWSNIRMMREHLTDRRTLQLLRSVDCLISLHRSEGFGLTVAEAMVLGTPTIVTGWSATREFTEGAAIQVPFRLIPAEDPSGMYSGTGERWADPDLDEAAAAMRLLACDDREHARVSASGLRLALERLGKPISSDPYREFLRPKLVAATAGT